MTGVRVVLALGGNVGDVESTMRHALSDLDRRGDLVVTAVSRLYATPPWGKTDQPEFINACARLETRLAPHDLLDLCLATEKRYGRERGERWGPRTLDLDLVDYDGRHLADRRLELPHPRARDRAFVLAPLADLLPDFRLDGRLVGDLLAEIGDADIRVLRDDRHWWRARE